MEEVRKSARNNYKDILEKNYKKLFEVDKLKKKEIKTLDEIANEIEMGTYNYTLEISINSDDFELFKRYKFVYLKVYFNLKFNKNSLDISKKIFNKKIDPKNLAKMKRSELYPEKWNKIYKIRTDETKKKRKKGAHRCPRCKSWFTEHAEVQTRSADESSTVKCICLDCQYNWKY